MTDRIYSFIGMAMKAGKLQSGEFACEKAVKTGKAMLIIVSTEASLNTKKNFSDMCSYRGVEIRFFGKKAELGKFSGKDMRAVLAVTDQGFARKLTEMIDSSDPQYGGGHIEKNQNI